MKNALSAYAREACLFEEEAREFNMAEAKGRCPRFPDSMAEGKGDRF